MKAALLATSLLVWQSTATGFLAQVFGFGGQTDNCHEWSDWSDCFSTDARDFFNQLPSGCYANRHVGMIVGAGRKVIDKVQAYAERVNNSAHACGMCNVQISCSPFCDTQSPGNKFGVTDRVCPGLATGQQACAMTAAVNHPITGECQVWPPLGSKPTDYIPAFVPVHYRDLLWNLKLTNCVNIAGRCYCCCAPFKPNPCDASCTMQPCADGTIFSVEQIVSLVRRSFAGGK